MILKSSTSCTLILAVFACLSCKENPELVEKRNQQKIEMARLQNEITIAREKLKTKPKDVSKDLAAAQKQLGQLTEEATQIEKEISDLQKQKEELEKEFAEYRKKYPIP